MNSFIGHLIFLGLLKKIVKNMNVVCLVILVLYYPSSLEIYLI